MVSRLWYDTKRIECQQNMFCRLLSIKIKLKYKYQNHLSNRGYIVMGEQQHETSQEPDRKERI